MSKLGWLRRHASTVVLSALAGTAGLWLLVDRASVTTKQAEQRRTSLLPAWRSDDLRSVRIESGARSLSIERADAPSPSGERPYVLVTEEGTVAADQQAVAQLFATLELATVARRVPETSVDREGFGLAPPLSTIVVDMTPLTLELAIGGPAPTPAGSVYAEVKGHGVFVISRDLSRAFDVTAAELRERHVIPWVSVDLARIALDREGGEPVVLEPAPWGGTRGSGYRLSPSGRRASPAQVEQVLGAFGRLEAEAFLPVEQGSQASRPELTVELTNKSGARARIAFGGACPQEAARVTPGGEAPTDLSVVTRDAPSALSACVTRASYARLKDAADRFRDRRIVGAHPDEIAELSIEHDGTRLDLARTGGGLKVRAPEERSVPPDTARSFFDALARIVGEPTDQASIDHALVTVEIHSPKGDGVSDRVERIRVGRVGDDGLHPVHRLEDDAVLLVEPSLLRPLSEAALLLRAREVIDVKAYAVKRITIEHAGFVQRVARRAEGFSLDATGSGVGSAVELEADAGFSLELVERVAKLEAVRWVTGADDGSFGLDPPRARLTVEIEPEGGGREQLVLRVGARTDDGAFAKIEGKTDVFVIDRDVEHATRRLLVARSAFHLDLEPVTRITLSRGQRELVLERKDRAFVAPSLDAAAASRVREALEGLIALRATGIGPAGKAEGFDQPVLSIRLERGEGPPLVIAIGAGDVLDETSVHLARQSDVDATFAVPQSAVRSLLVLFE